MRLPVDGALGGFIAVAFRAVLPLIMLSLTIRLRAQVRELTAAIGPQLNWV